ncbi:MAG: glycosyltransferase family 4 protein [Desulfurococcaceae archaeon]|nr:glycosyltransferase family 4 protein [Desulfurococcaceae archaeon]
MRVLFIAPSYYPHIGGVEYVVKSVAERLTKAGHETIVVAGEPSTDKPREDVVEGVKVIRWPIWSPGNAYHIPRKGSELEKLLKELARQVDVVHVHSVHSIFTVYAGLVIASSSASPRIVVTPHYHGTGHTFVRRVLWTFWRWRVAELLNKASTIHAVSKREASILASHYPEARSKIIVIPNGVDEDVLSYRWQGQSSNYMVYAGRVEKYKRLEIAVDIAKELNLKLLIIGKGPYREKLVRYASKVYRGGVEFLEPQPRQKYLELVSRARYAINPSKYEAFSMFAAEALAIGTPAIVTKEIAENLEAQAKPLVRDLVVAEKAQIKTWNEMLLIYVKEFYKP